MRTPQYLSPTSIAKWGESVDEFFLTYLADVPAPRFPQTQPMSIGSAFDARVKSFLHEALFGKGNDPRFELKTIFEAQVEIHNRDWAWEHGAYAFECYQKSGALADLMLELQAAIGTPRFEFKVQGAISGYREGVTTSREGVILLGKPDVFFINRGGCHVTLDFKVNGWCSQYNVSPMPGYMRVRAGNAGAKSSGPHADCFPTPHRGMMVNGAQYLDQLDAKWADQLAIYAWLLGCDIGEDFITAVDQFCCKPSGGKFPIVRIAQHRLRIGADYQWRLLARAQEIWEIVHSDHIFRSLSREDSVEKCRLLDAQARDLHAPAESPEDQMFNDMTREQRNY